MEIEEGVIIVVVVVVVFRILVLGIKMYQSSSPSRDERNIIWGNCSPQKPAVSLSLDWSQTNCTNVPSVPPSILLVCIM